jgi:chromosome segregation ATPase
VLDAPADSAPEHAHFFLAACSQSPIAETRAFAWMPSSGNVLRERLHHISLLESEIERKNEWLAEAGQSHAKLQQAHEDVLAELRESNAWAARLNGELDVARAVMSRLESEAQVRLDWIGGLERQIRDLEAQTERGRTEIARLGLKRDEMKNTIAERTQWAQSLDEEVERLGTELQSVRTELQSVQTELQFLEDAKWVRRGRKLHLIPAKPGSAGDLVAGGPGE